ncbi:hypothetical protein AB0M41_27725 [Streptomyces sp. NPDC051896]|uniref:hypothetical protein n=1 Tax=Streptomyces sp. NPDC051896 TaxID=3155416 RepID=UPI00341797BF
MERAAPAGELLGDGPERRPFLVGGGPRRTGGRPAPDGPYGDDFEDESELVASGQVAPATRAGDDGSPVRGLPRVRAGPAHRPAGE